MGKEQTSDFYNEIFSKSEEYRVHYKDSPYFVLWTQVLQFIRNVEKPRILEVGCGSGQFAHYLYDEGYKHYHGFDFSQRAIDIAKKTVDQSFSLSDAISASSYGYDYNVVVALEVMEHIRKDLEVIGNIKQGSYFIFSVPTFVGPAHVRWFTNLQKIHARYYRLLDLKKIIRIENWFVCFSVVENFAPTYAQRILKTRGKVTLRYVARRVYYRIRRYLGI